MNANKLNVNSDRRRAPTYMPLVLMSMIAFATQVQVWAQTPLECAEIKRIVPPEGPEIPDNVRQTWLAEIQRLKMRAGGELNAQIDTDVAVLLKACEYAIEFQELYRGEKDFPKVDRLLKLADERIDELEAGKSSWRTEAGLTVRGFTSKVDGSAQPVGLVVPDEAAQSDKPLPLYVWLHGRGDKTTDLHFICERLDKVGQIAPDNAIVIHPFGRQCIGYKSTGEIDVLEAIDFACENYNVDQRRIVLMGFSMGGAGVWHLAAHYGERFVAASPGAGFAETARYRKLTPDRYPAEYVQKLWSVYDVPGYVRNLFNLPVVAYSGENDKQIQAARVMEEAYAAEGRELTHLIGPGMEHKYHPDTLAEILRRMATFAEKGQPESPNEIFIQAPHLRYGSRAWLTIDGNFNQYSDTRAEATRGGRGWIVKTKNVSRLAVDTRHAEAPQGKTLWIDRQGVDIQPNSVNLLMRSEDGTWSRAADYPKLRKHPKLSGPIDDAFLAPFLVVVPSGKSSSAKIDQWVSCELALFQLRWRSLFRGQLRIKSDADVTAEDLKQYHLILWGTPESNQWIRKLMTLSGAGGLPLQWSEDKLTAIGKSYASATHVPVVIYPNPMNPEHYVVLNSGPTFRPAHDVTNSLQNPHLPDWAVISVEEAPSAERPGKIVQAGFFDDLWQFDQRLTW